MATNVRFWPKADIQSPPATPNLGRFHVILGHLAA